jgi:hypothetical protein
MVRNALVAVSGGDATVEELWDAFKGPGSSKPILYRWIKPIRTANEHAERSRAMLGYIGRPWQGGDPEIFRYRVEEPREVIRLLAEGNPGGHLFLTSLPSLRPNEYRWVLDRRTRLAMARAKLALRRYHDDHGSLPPTLHALVPAYLESVPPDWLGGAAVRYDPARRVLWGVGRNLSDEGGNPTSRDDTCVVLDWLGLTAAGSVPE